MRDWRATSTPTSMMSWQCWTYGILHITMIVRAAHGCKRMVGINGWMESVIVSWRSAISQMSWLLFLFSFFHYFYVIDWFEQHEMRNRKKEQKYPIEKWVYWWVFTQRCSFWANYFNVFCKFFIILSTADFSLFIPTRQPVTWLKKNEAIIERLKLFIMTKRQILCWYLSLWTRLHAQLTFLFFFIFLLLERIIKIIELRKKVIKNLTKIS